jgi:hypothetical protein
VSRTKGARISREACATAWPSDARLERCESLGRVTRCPRERGDRASEGSGDERRESPGDRREPGDSEATVRASGDEPRACVVKAFEAIALADHFATETEVRALGRKSVAVFSGLLSAI